MKYYILDVDVEPKVIGVRDGCAQAEIKRSGFTDKGLYDKTMKLMGSFESSISYVPDFDLELQYVKMKKSAKVTDIMLFSPILLNCKFDVDILEAFKSTGKGWQTRMNNALRDWLKNHSPSTNP